MKKKKLIIFFLILLLFFVGFKMVSAIKTYYVRANSEEYRLIDDVLKEYGTGLYPLEAEIDVDGKSIFYNFKQKRGVDISRKDYTWEDIENMREMMNAYLDEHPDYYLNDNYSIYVNIQWVNQGPWVAITNDKSRLRIEGVDGLYNHLDCIIINTVPYGESLQVPVQIFKGAKGVYFNGASVLEANYEALLQMKSVEYYNAPPLKNTTDYTVSAN